MPRALHGHEGRPTRLAPAPRALGARAMSDDEQTQLEAHAPVEGGAQLSHGPGTAAETGAAALAGAAEAVTDPPATLRARMIADLANFVPAGTNVEAVADVLLYHNFANMHEVMEVELTASDLIELFPFDRFDPDLVVALRVGLAVAVVVRGVTLLGTASYTPPTGLAESRAPVPGGVARVPAGTGDAGAGGEPDALGVRAPPLRLFSIANCVVRTGGASLLLCGARRWRLVSPSGTATRSAATRRAGASGSRGGRGRGSSRPQ